MWVDTTIIVLLIIVVVMFISTKTVQNFLGGPVFENGGTFSSIGTITKELPVINRHINYA
jgi:hypothetical protein